MFINKLNQLYKPKRTLYYIEADGDKLKAFFKGTLPEEIAKYADAFGTYDYPGVFFIRQLEKEVIGIEFRSGDKRIDYPAGLKSIELEEAFFYSVEFDDDIHISRTFIRELFEKISKDDDAHRAYSDLSINKSPNAIGVFSSYKKIRVLYEWKLESDRASDIINDNIEKFDKTALYKAAFFDPITNHSNWNHLVPYLEMPEKANIQDYAFVHFDVKEFRIINEVYGHIAANKVLSKIVKAMNNADFVYASARCHNDNFAMIIKDMPEAETLAKLQKFFDDLSYLEEDPNYRIYYRCGLVPMQRAMLSGNRVADAGKMAQGLGNSTNKTDIIIYTDKMHNDILWGNYIKAYVDTAIKNDEFIVYLQPKFDIHTEKIKGAEALIRWNYKSKEFLSPGRFIPFFEKDGNIAKIDDLVLRKVCESFAKWKSEGKELYPISVNLSRNQLYDKNLIDHLVEIVDSYAIDHALIDFELTESATYDDMSYMIEVLHTLRQKGFKISMDDFGTGYSSLSLLTEMPLDTLKIDKSFVDKVGTDTENVKDLAVIRHIISLAKELHFTCLAEGAEQKCQIEKLRSLGCEVIQGYYYSKPLPIAEYEQKYLSGEPFTF
ncbi:MAG: EAL domain-containing protein [Spirochaetaceae bacterium]|nr:EAL domain-containing protein [Spirochaetaceae bacterium]